MPKNVYREKPFVVFFPLDLHHLLIIPSTLVPILNNFQKSVSRLLLLSKFYIRIEQNCVSNSIVRSVTVMNDSIYQWTFQSIFMMTFSFTRLIQMFSVYFALTGQPFPALNELWALLYKLNVTNYDE